MVRVNSAPKGPPPAPPARPNPFGHTHSLPPPDYRLISGWKEPDNRTFEEKHVLALGRLLVGLVLALPVLIALMVSH